MPSAEERLIDPSPDALVAALVAVTGQAQGPRSLVRRGAKAWRQFLQEAAGLPQGARRWVADPEHGDYRFDHGGHPVVLVAWWTDHVGRRHWRAGGAGPPPPPGRPPPAREGAPRHRPPAGAVARLPRRHLPEARRVGGVLPLRRRRAPLGPRVDGRALRALPRPRPGAVARHPRGAAASPHPAAGRRGG